MTPEKAINFNVITEAFEIVKNRWQPFVLAGLVAVLSIVIVEGIFFAVFFSIGMIGGNNSTAAFATLLPVMLVFYVAIFFLVAMMQAGFSSMAMKVIEGGEVELADFFTPFKTPIPFLIAGLLIALASILGVFACFVGTYIVQGLLMFVYPFMYHRKLSPMDAAKASYEALKPHWLMATCFWFVASLVGGLGVIACYVGILFTLPITFVAKSLVFRDLCMDKTVAASPTEQTQAVAELDENKPSSEPEV